MSTQKPIRETKRQISSALLDTPGISGVGLRGEHVVIYLEREDAKLQQHASALVKEIAPDVSLLFEHSGSFNKREGR